VQSAESIDLLLILTADFILVAATEAFFLSREL
jgi:hypothetical protein